MRLVPRSRACSSALSRAIQRWSTKTASSWSANSIRGAAAAAAGKRRPRAGQVGRANFRIIYDVCRQFGAVGSRGCSPSFAKSLSADDPLSGLEVGERPEPEAPEGWATVEVRAASLNHHDLWSLRGRRAARGARCR